MSGGDSWRLAFACFVIGGLLIIGIVIIRMLVHAIRHGNWSSGSELLARLTSVVMPRRVQPPPRDLRGD
ncbi:MAG: hypothetical protein KIS84_04215 [Dokdonella sp.]|uniref:hypothetical protein n=1 Tax=Dokdonella sp. TaxID=2291710 RepID=UPI0031BE6BD0|nr:hypothetical protein [Dokdonella sp.]